MDAARAERKARRVAIVGGGPSGIVTARYLISQGLEPTLFEQSEDIGGQWNWRSPHSGVWPAMRTNTSRVMTQFSDLRHEPGTAVYPTNQEIHAYLHRYARAFGVMEHVRLNTCVERVEQVEGGYRIRSRTANAAPQVEDYPFVVVASGRYTKPRIPAVQGLADFSGRGGVLHTAGYKDPERFRGMRVLVCGCAISALEIASNLAMIGAQRVVAAYRRQRYIVPKLAAGIPTDHLLFTRWAAYAEEVLPEEVMLAGLKEMVLRLAGSPEQFGAMRPDGDIRKAGISLAQQFLPLVAEGRIRVKPWIHEIDGQQVTFTDGSQENFDALLFGTGFDLDLPFLSDGLREKLRVDDYSLDLYDFTFHPDLERLGFVGMYDQVGPYFPVLELQARWLAYVWGGTVARAGEAAMRTAIREFQPLRKQRVKQSMHRMAIRFAQRIGADASAADFPALERALFFGPLAPVSFRLQGPDELPAAAEIFADEIAQSGSVPSPELTPEQRMQLDALRRAMTL